MKSHEEATMEMPETWQHLKQKCHLISELKDGETDLVIYKWWSPGKQRWNYEAREKYLVEADIRWEKKGEMEK